MRHIPWTMKPAFYAHGITKEGDATLNITNCTA